jgi:hypothetical protein
MMPVNSANQGIPEQQGTDIAYLPGAQVAWDGVMENRLAQRYASIADRTARNPAPNEGEVSHLADVDRYEVFNNANWISLGLRSKYFFGIRGTDQAAINNSTALVSDGTMSAPLVAAGTFTFTGTLIYDCSTVADLKIAIAWPGGASGKTYYWGLDPAVTTATASSKQGLTTASATTFSFAGVGVGTLVTVKFEGRVTTVGAGNLVVQYAQQNLDATNLTIRADSFLEVMRIA